MGPSPTGRLVWPASNMGMIAQQGTRAFGWGPARVHPVGPDGARLIGLVLDGILTLELENGG